MINEFNNPNETLWDGIFPEEDVYQIEKFFGDQEIHAPREINFSLFMFLYSFSIIFGS